MIFPGKAATYVLRCPLNYASSETPPNEILVNSFPKALAIDFAIEVLPTPGGPFKHKIFPLLFPLLNLTARN